MRLIDPCSLLVDMGAVLRLGGTQSAINQTATVPCNELLSVTDCRRGLDLYASLLVSTAWSNMVTHQA
jgi:hypothetical protein